MLNKDLCILCNKKYWTVSTNTIDEETGMYARYKDDWCSIEERLWNVWGRASCPDELTENSDMGFADIEEPPPSWCPFSVEHIVLENDTKECL